MRAGGGAALGSLAKLCAMQGWPAALDCEIKACSTRYALRAEDEEGELGWELVLLADVACTGPEYSEALALAGAGTHAELRVPLRLTLLAPDDYPDVPPFDCELRPGALREALPARACQLAEAALAATSAEHAGSERGLRSLLRWAESYLGEILLVALREGGEEVCTTDSVGGDDAAEAADDAAGGDSNDEGSDDGQEQAVFSAEAVRAAADGSRSDSDYAVCLEGLALDGVDAAECAQARLHLSCGSCGTRAEAQLLLGAGGGTAVWRGACDACGSKCDVAAGAALMHDGSNRLLRLDITPRWRPLDLPSAVLGGECSCDAPLAFRTTPGARAMVRCRRCHSQASVQWHQARIEAVTRGGGERRTEHSQARRGKESQQVGRKGGSGRAQVLIKGSPLPGKGACTHYKHSNRWFRFPCCGGLFPCDVCHDLSAATDKCAMAPMARRMVCGYCSEEQSVTPECRQCGKALAGGGGGGGGGGRFWNGGKGCRNQTLLSGKDSRKHRGSKHKTQSKKNQRVGAAGSARSKAKAKATTRVGD